MACSVAPALPHEIFHRVGAGGFARVSKPRHRRTGAVVFSALQMFYDDAELELGTEDEVAGEETRLLDLGAGGFALARASKPRHRRTGAVFAGTDDEVAEVLRPVVPVPDSDSFSIAAVHAPPPGDVGALAEAAGIRRERKVRFDLPAEEESVVAAAPPPRFPTGVLGEPPERESLARSGPEMTAAFLASVVIAAADAANSDTPADDRELLVARWTERKEACSRRASYLRDYCPFQRDDEEEEEREPETTTTLPAEPDHAEAAPARVKTGLAFDSPESEAEFVKAIRSRYLLKDDFVSCKPVRHKSLQVAQRTCVGCESFVKVYKEIWFLSYLSPQL